MSGTNSTARRDFLKQAAVFGAGVMASTAFALEPRATPKIKNIYPFYGAHQQGIATPAQKKHLLYGVRSAFYRSQ